MEKRRFTLSDGQGCAILAVIGGIILAMAYFFLHD